MPSKEKINIYSREINKELNSILKKSYNVNLNDASNIELGDAFTRYYVEQYLKEFYSLDDDELSNGLNVGGPNDLDIDFIYEAPDQFIVVQCKYRSTGNINTSDINKFTDLYKNTLFNGQAAKLGNDRVKDYLYSVRQNKNKKNIIMEFVYNKKFTKSIEQKISTSEAEMMNFSQDNELPEPTINWIDINELWNLYEKGIRERKDKSPWPIQFKSFKDDALCLRFNKKDIKSNAWFDLKEFDETDSRTLVLLIDAWVVKRLYDKYGNFLFNENIRLFQGKNKSVNAGIIKTIETQPEKFFVFNNGISAVCDNIDVSRSNISVTGMQIINGAQTVLSIHQAGKDGSESNFRDIHILLKITQTKDQALKESITRFNNSQTAIVPADFRANDPIQKFLNKKLSDYYYFGPELKGKPKKIKYLNKRQPADRRFKEIKLPDLTKLLATLKLDPTVASKNDKLFDDNINQGNYWNCFGNKGKKVKVYTKGELDILVARISIWFRLDYIRKEKMRDFIKENPEKRDTIPHLAYQPRFHFFWAYNYIIQKFYSEKWESIVKSINDGSLFKENNIIDKWFPKIHSQIAVTLNTKVDDGLNFRNWQRTKDDSTDKLKSFIDLQLVEDYPY